MDENHSYEMYSVKLPNKAIVKLLKYNPLQECEFQILHKAAFNILTLVQNESCSTYVTKYGVFRKVSSSNHFFLLDFHFWK